MATKMLESSAVSAFCESVAVMHSAGIQMDEAVFLLGENMEDAAFKRACDDVYKELIVGKPLALAMDDSGCFPSHVVDMVGAGEHAGRLENVLWSLARYYDEEDRLYAKIKNAIAYPAAQLCVMSAILLFTVPPATPIVKGIYVFITNNFCTTVVYTALNLPYATLATLMTRDTDQRAVVNLFRTGMSALGNMVITAITFPLVTRLGDTQQAWIEVSILYAIVSIIMLFICFKNCHERVKEETKTKDGKNVPLWMGIKLCVTNKYFIMFFMLAVFLSFYEAVTGTCNAYYAQYILGNRDLLGELASFESIPQIVTVLVLSPFIAKFGKRNVALIGAIVAVIGTVSLFINPSALNLALFACVMRGIGKGCFRGVKYSMLADVIEYGAWKSGIRVQGLMVSATTAGQKFGSGMTSAIFGALMSLVGFAGTVTINAAQSQMLIAIYIIGNIIAWGGIGVLLLFYKLDKIYPRIITEMKQREAAEAEKAAANA